MKQWIKFQTQGQAPIMEDVVYSNPDRGLALIADGFGGNPGRAAADVVVKAMADFIESEAGDLDATLPFEIRKYFSLIGNVLFNAVAFANRKLVQVQSEQTWKDQGGASLIAAYMEGSNLAIASVGACRISLERGGLLQRLNTPRTLGSLLSPFGENEGNAFEIPLMSFGTSPDLEPEIIEVKLKEGDRLILESSGVTNSIRTEVDQGVAAELDSLRNASMIKIDISLNL